MGKNRARKQDGYRRGKAFERPRKKRILIVCEGTKTEPNYFSEIRQELRLPQMEVWCVPSHLGTAPLQVVQSAIDILKLNGDIVDTVFCVFDRDDHAEFWNAILKAEAHNRKSKVYEFIAIPSVPCFEVWLLMHFCAVTGEMERKEANDRLKSYLQGYDKGCDFAYDKTKHLLEVAYENAEKVKCNEGKLCDHASRWPFTRVDDVVRQIMDLQGKSR